MPAFIDDGFTLDGTIEANEAHELESVRFQYRPATAREVTVWLQGRESLSGDVKGDRDCDFIARHLVSWSLAKRDGSSVPVSKECVGKLHWYVHQRMMNIIAGFEQGDPSAPDMAKALGN